MTTHAITALALMFLALWLLNKFVHRHLVKTLEYVFGAVAFIGAATHPHQVIALASDVITKLWPAVYNTAQKATNAFVVFVNGVSK